MPEKDFGDLAAKAKKAIKELVNKEPLSVIGISEAKGNWQVLVEVLERRAVPDTQNIIGKYRLEFSKAGNLLGYERTELRRKADTGEETITAEEAK